MPAKEIRECFPHNTWIPESNPMYSYEIWIVADCCLSNNDLKYLVIYILTSRFWGPVASVYYRKLVQAGVWPLTGSCPHSS